MSIKAVVTDFGGVLVRTGDPSGRRKWEKILKIQQGELSRLVFDSEVAVKATVGALPRRAIWENLASKFQLDEPEMDQLQSDFWSGDRLDVDLVDFLSSLRPRYKVAILSNAWTDAREEFTRQFHLDRLADLIIISSEERLAKPDPRIFHLLAARLEVDFPEIIFIDDFSENIHAAESLGIKVVPFHTTPQAIEDIKKILVSQDNLMS